MVDGLKCRVIEMNRGTTHDGPGLRTTVFLKGCPLRCLWCQNPEGMGSGQEVWWEERKCIHCLECVDACPCGAIRDEVGMLRVERESCSLCGACVEACPARAMTFTAQEWTMDGLLKEVLKDRDYYRAFGGGVTVSGGEPLGQYRFVTEFFQRLHAAGVHTALDTCGLAAPDALHSVLPHVDHVLYDIKFIDSESHLRYTRQPNGLILSNLLEIARFIRESRDAPPAGDPRDVQLWIRTPLIPGITDTIENITAIGAFIREHLLDVVQRWELCAFNPACHAKYKKLGLTWELAAIGLMEQDTVDAILATARATGIPAEKVAVTGLVARSESPSGVNSIT